VRGKAAIDFNTGKGPVRAGSVCIVGGVEKSVCIEENVRWIFVSHSPNGA